MNLKECPFCGGTPRMVRVHGRAWVACPQCKAETRLFESRSSRDPETEAADAWNRRSEKQEADL